MSQTIHTAHHGQAQADVIDLTDRLAKRGTPAAARAAVQATEHGVADLTTGTIHHGTVVEQLPARRGTAALRSTGTAALTVARVTGRITATTLLGAGTAIARIWDYQQAGDYARIIRATRRQERAGDLAPDVAEAQVAQLRAERRDVQHARHREPLAIVGAATGAGYAAALIAIAQLWSAALLAPALLPLVTVLYVIGRREQAARQESDVVPGVVIESEPVQADGERPFGADAIDQALRTAGLIADDQHVTMVGIPRPLPGGAVEATFELPGKLEVADLIDKVKKVAKGFRVQHTWIDLREGSHPGECVLWLARSSPFNAVRVSPLVEKPERQDAVDRGVLIGYNRRGELIYLRLWHVMALLGGASRTGKGMLLRSIICGLALDPRVNLRLVAGAKPGEHAGYAPACATFFGRDPERLIALLEALLEEGRRREEVGIRQRRAKLSERDLPDFPLEVLIIDEYKQYAASKRMVPGPLNAKGEPTLIKACDRIAELLEETSAFVAALNITILISTQDPDANTIPRGYRSNVGARIATRTGGAAQTNAILSDGATGSGLRAHDITEEMKGCAIVDINGTPGELIRSFYIEDDEHDGAEPIITAARALREKAGRAPGQFDDKIEAELLARTGETSIAGGPTGMGYPGAPEGAPAAGQAAGLLALLLAVFAAAGDPAHLRTAELLAGLAALAPDPWEAIAGGDPRTAGRALREAIAAEMPDGVELTPVERSWGRGYLLADIQAAAGIAPK